MTQLVLPLVLRAAWSCPECTTPDRHAPDCPVLLGRLAIVAQWAKDRRRKAA